nr:MAG TPA: hypothetical protein [Caudoviricetes sp.]
MSEIGLVYKCYIYLSMWLYLLIALYYTYR